MSKRSFSAMSHCGKSTQASPTFRIRLKNCKAAKLPALHEPRCRNAGKRHLPLHQSFPKTPLMSQIATRLNRLSSPPFDLKGYLEARTAAVNRALDGLLPKATT